ncbi:Trk system potassium uptake protein [Algimonas ampicilliniresistens]|uniref:Trk system potassium uptake protein n=1 Tax=Algimonas ampicilliniresistens TaxID=1298735 RepID=A0ABQ5V7V5_9PROT|nr:potassium transporter TrkG [Algimonas ampicilliniresistens]GLQ23628.1 Trk system potassium uptake protein [Algimonas ampicilliniresistens]
MRLVKILLWLGYSLFTSAALMLITALVALLVFEVRNAGLMAILAVLSALVGGLMITASFKASTKESSGEAILFLVLYWAVVPIVCSLPFYVLGATSGPIAAIFEGVSAITTTGASTLDAEVQSRTLLFYRSLLQFFGGVSVAVFAVVVLAALNLTGTGIHRSGLFTFRSGELFTRFLGVGQLVAAIYLFLSAVAFVLMVMGGTDTFTALCLALSGISTGGLQPFVGPLANVLSPVSAIVLALLCLVGAFNISILWDFLRLRRLRPFLRLFVHVEHRGLFAIAACLTLITLIFAGLSNFGPAILDSIFFVSSAGFRYDVISLDMVPSPILICVALIGGSALSTAGGIKVIRLLLLFRHLGTDMARLSHPSRVKPIEFRGNVIDDDEFLSIWMYFFGYALCFAFGALALAASGLNLQDSMATSAASLANMGPLLDMTLPSSGLRYGDFSGLQMTVAALLMLIGRVEVLVALSLLLPSTWRQ